MVLLMDNLKSMAQLWVNLGRQFGIHQRTQDTFETRVACEGRQFLYIDLTQLGRDFDRALIGGEPFNTVARFRLAKGKPYPAFLSELFKQVLDRDGVVMPDASAETIRHIRQLTLLYYKVRVPHDEDDIHKALTSFMERDSSLDRQLPDEVVTRKARRYLHEILGSVDPRTSVPRHGSGATACRTPNCDKYHSYRFIPRLNAVFPYDEFFYFNATHLCDQLDTYLHAEEIEDPPARIVAVPKDMRGPRLICCEPRERQYIQQGLMRLLYKAVEEHPLTSGYVNFTDQGVNRALTLEASEYQNWCTLDLKDASDRVRWDLVQHLFPGNWVEALDACRTRFVDMGGGELFGPMRKFAPMGSAVCFPVEALVFWSLLQSILGCPVYVYGDDIILPTAFAAEASHILESFDLKVNEQKSCYKTPFRESCGLDCWLGSDVSYVKAREEFNSSLKSETAWVDFVNNIADSYSWSVADQVKVTVDQAFGPHYCTVLGLPLTYKCEFRSSNFAFFKHRKNADLQRLEALIPCPESPRSACRTSEPFHWNEMLRYTVAGGGDNWTLGEYVEPNHSHKKYRWSFVI